MKRHGGPRWWCRAALRAALSIAVAAVFVVVGGAGCAPPPRLAARTTPATGEKLAAHVALFVAPSQLGMEYINYAEGDDRAAYSIELGHALQTLAAAHLAEVVAVVTVSEAARAPHDAARDSFLVELETVAFDASTDGRRVTWQVRARIADELGLRSFRTYEAAGTSAADAGAGGGSRHARLEAAANDAMRQLVGELWGELKGLSAHTP